MYLFIYLPSFFLWTKRICLNLKLSLVCISLVNELVCLRCYTEYSSAAFICVFVGAYIFVYIYICKFIFVYIYRVGPKKCYLSCITLHCTRGITFLAHPVCIYVHVNVCVCVCVCVCFRYHVLVK